MLKAATGLPVTGPQAEEPGTAALWRGPCPVWQKVSDLGWGLSTMDRCKQGLLFVKSSSTLLSSEFALSSFWDLTMAKGCEK